jgi:glucokinase
MTVAIGVDVGGTKILAGAVNDAGDVLSRRRIATPVHAEMRVAAIVDLVRSLCAEQGLGGVPVGVGAAGLVNLDGVVLYAPNLDWRDAPVRAQLAARLGMPVRVENDAAAATWGEFVAGAATHASVGALMLTVGTGVGGGLVMDGRLIRRRRRVRPSDHPRGRSVVPLWQPRLP